MAGGNGSPAGDHGGAAEARDDVQASPAAAGGEARVTVVVPTRNSVGTIERCLASIRAQSYDEVELIVVDNGSTDGTAERATRFADQVLQAGPERSAQRNRGVLAGTGSYVFIVDSDMVLSPAVVARCIEQIRRSDAAGVVVPERSEGEGWWASCKALERSCYVGDATIEAPRFFTRAAFERYGGYDEQLTGPEDWDLPARMRPYERFTRIEEEIVHLEGRLSLLGSMRKKYYYGRDLRSYARRHPELFRRQIARPAFARHWRRLSSDPVLAAGMVVMKSAEMAAGALGFAVAAIEERRPRT